MFADGLLLAEDRYADGADIFKSCLEFRNVEGGLDHLAVPLEEEHSAFFLAHFAFERGDEIAVVGGIDQGLDFGLISLWQIGELIDSLVPVGQGNQIHQRD